MESLHTVLQELTKLAADISSDKEVLELINNARKVFVFGAGRSGLALKMFAMRLAQMQQQVEVVGDATTGPIEHEDLLLVASGSGETQQTKDIAQKASATGATILLLTTSPSSSLAKMANYNVILGGKSKYAADISSIQPMGAAFEQLVLLYSDALVLDLMAKWHLSEKKLQANHANLE
ncbi:6-phospho-3-hexuloisomerase [Ligilactobacillus acidipiscis]|uniref:6-phospho-3-hexuloisomerase n=1 Tax=Ligilactobacillus acidipiscis TaxID=89059 RepID=UPI0023F6FF37|nr:6-phospho-3-hexuloisomerase [Ligilactobacillus acidipiscis]WEV58135.1 SIS domain-containing protein [Ligilactobacillus acidipiscis]